VLSIDRLKISLPAGYEQRAGSISRLVAQRLADSPQQTDARLAYLAPPTVSVSRGMNDQGVAHLIADAILAQINKEVP